MRAKPHREMVIAPGAARRPRLLFLAYYFPPANKVGGVRAFNMAKALAARGWEITVVSPAVSMWRAVEREDEVSQELEEAGIRCIRTGHTWRNLSPDDLSCRDSRIAWIWGGLCRRTLRSIGAEPQVGWANEVAEACAVLDREDVDLVLASGPPFIGFRLASEIARRLERPYVLDYRDLWTRNPHSGGSVRRSASSTERDLIAAAAAVTVVSAQLAESLRADFRCEDKIAVVTNGYDPDGLSRVKPRDFGHFAIVYTGQFYPPKRVIDPLLSALTQLKNMGDLGREWRFHYFGPHERDVASAMAGQDLLAEVVLHGSVSRSDALAAVAGAGVCVVITSVRDAGSREDLGIVTGKVFEAIGLKKPVLAIAPPGSDLETILADSAAARRFSGSEIKPMAEFIAELVRGGPLARPVSEKYSWSTIGDRVDTLLRQVVRGNRSQEIEIEDPTIGVEDPTPERVPQKSGS